jgi:methyltransferase-like protein 6
MEIQKDAQLSAAAVGARASPAPDQSRDASCLHPRRRSPPPSSRAAKLEANAARYWDAFYRVNADRFFKLRHWFAAEFGSALAAAAAVLEVGCGTGASVFPLLELNPRATIYACDFAPTAVAHVLSHPQHAASGRVVARVADLTRDPLTAWVPAAGVDACTMIFVLSALSPATMPAALANVAATLRPGAGRVLFRDYAAGDLAQARLAAAGRRQRIGEAFYARGDGTRAFYFTRAGAQALFEAAGFRCEVLEVLEREGENRRRGVRMERRFLQGVFLYVGAAAGPLAEQAVVPCAVPCAVPRPADPLGAGFAVAAAPAEVAATAALGGWSLRLRLPAGAPSQPPIERSAGAFLARAVLRARPLLWGRSAVELGAGAAALPTMAALRWAARAVATDPDPAALRLLRANAAANGHLVVIERMRSQALAWGDAAQAGVVLGAAPGGFDVVLLAAEPALLSRGAEGEEGDEESVRRLEAFFATAAALLAPDGVVVAAAAGAAGAAWAAAAAAAGLRAAALPAEMLEGAGEQAAGGLELAMFRLRGSTL